jgi:hypothetical protein
MVSRATFNHILIPYDGNDIGAFIGDAIRNIRGSIIASYYNEAVGNIVPLGVFSEGKEAFKIGPVISNAVYSGAIVVGTNVYSNEVKFSAVNQGLPTANENRPASISVQYFISY